MSVTPQVFFSFDTPWASDVFVLDDPVKGVLDNATYVLSGDIPVDLAGFMKSISISRGRQSEFDEFQSGTATIVLYNYDRAFDPAYASGPYFGNITRGKRVQVQSSLSRPLITGIVDDWDFDYPLGGVSTATATIVDGLSTLVGIGFNEWTGTASQTTGQRVTAVLDRPEVAYPASRDIGTGIATLAADVIADGTNVLEYLQTLGRTEVGRIFDSRAGLLTFRDRHYVPTHLATAVTVGESGTPFNAIARSEGKETVRNYVKVTMTTGATEESFDQASIDANGTSSLLLDGIPLETTSQAADLADFMAGAYSTAFTMFAAVSFTLHGLTEAQADALCVLDIGDPIEVEFTPNGLGDPVTQVAVIEGFAHDLRPMEHTLTLYLSRAEQTALFILDDATYGALDGSGLLAF